MAISSRGIAPAGDPAHPSYLARMTMQDKTAPAATWFHRRFAVDDADDKTGASGARAFATHVFSLSATKLADGLIDPKLVLSWLLTHLGAPGALLGLLVPVREAGALAPQLLIAPGVRSATQRKWFWIGGSVVQGLAALVIAAAALTLDGTAAGIAIVLALGILAIGRAFCSTSYKDVLGKTVPKGSRGTTTGIAGSAAAVFVLAFGAGLALGIIPRTTTAIACAVALAGALWLLAALLFSRLDEPRSDIDDAKSFGWRDLVAPLGRHAQLRRFIVARALLVPTALAPPFIVALGTGRSESGGAETLGPLVLASALASILGGYLWGRLSDRSSRLSLMIGGGLAALAIGATALWSLGGGTTGLWLLVPMLFLTGLGYEGVRSGRKTHLTDMAGENERAVFTALSNTIIGGVLLLGGLLGVLADFAGIEAALIASALLCLAGVAVAAGLENVQADAR